MAPLKLEAVNAHESVQFALDRIANVLPDTGGKQLNVRFGQTSVTFTASNQSATVTQPHRLGRVPALVLYGNRGAASLAVQYREESTDATNLKFHAFTTNLANVTGSQNCYWLAIG